MYNIFTAKNSNKKAHPYEKISKTTAECQESKIQYCKAIEDKNREKHFVAGLEMTKGQKCRCPKCGRKCRPYDAKKEKCRWLAPDFSTSKAFIESAATRIKCERHGFLTEKVLWARYRSM